MCADPSLKKHFKTRPARAWTSPAMKEKLAKEGKHNATVLPIIIATDQTNLSIMCGGQKAYPVYISLANVSKGWRRKPSKRAMALLGYLPVEAFEDIKNDDERRRLQAELIHCSLEKMLAPLRKASANGVEMWCPDGRLRRTTYKGRGDLDQEADLREREETLGVLRSYFVKKSVAELRPLNLKPVWPWWGDIPEVNLATCFTPDLLHQLYQGVFKTHLVKWLRHLVGDKKLDERLMAMPPAEGLHHFAKGITGVSQWTGRVSKQLVSQILPAVAGLMSVELTDMVRSLIDFTFRAHAPSMTDTDIEAMERDLARFHELKGLLVAKGIYQSEARFDKIPKLHMLAHYTHMIREMGTPDGFNTEAPEHLHIEFAKEPWRASNKVRPLPQMVKYLQRQEAIRLHRAYLDQYMGLDHDEDNDMDEGEEIEEDIVDVTGLRESDENGGGDGETHSATAATDSNGVASGSGGVSEGGADAIAYPNPRRQMAKHPTKPNVPVRDVISNYGASDVIPAITAFLGRRLGIPPHDVLMTPHNRVHVWHKLYLYHEPLHFAPFDPRRRDVVRASPPVWDLRNRLLKKPVWDVALYAEEPNRLRSSNERYEKHGDTLLISGPDGPIELQNQHPLPLSPALVVPADPTLPPATSPSAEPEQGPEPKLEPPESPRPETKQEAKSPVPGEPVPLRRSRRLRKEAVPEFDEFDNPFWLDGALVKKLESWIGMGTECAIQDAYEEPYVTKEPVEVQRVETESEDEFLEQMWRLAYQEREEQTQREILLTKLVEQDARVHRLQQVLERALRSIQRAKGPADICLLDEDKPADRHPTAQHRLDTPPIAESERTKDPFNREQIAEVLRKIRIGDDLSPEQRKRVMDLIGEYADIFALSLSEVLPIDFTQLKLDIPEGTSFPKKAGQKRLTEPQR
ncbi:hypothetical protein FRC07_012232, partial [Ceratobasidium sp. 392]